MSKTIKQLAEELSVTKSCVRHKIEILNLQSKLKKVGNQFVIDNKQEKLIINSLKRSLKNNNSAVLSSQNLSSQDLSSQDLPNQDLLDSTKSIDKKTASNTTFDQVNNINVSKNDAECFQQDSIPNILNNQNQNNYDLNNSNICQNELYQTLKTELAIKDSQISTLTKQLSDLINQNSQLTVALQNTTESLKSAQALHAGTIKQQLTDNNNLNNNPELKRKWWSFWK